MDDMKKENRNAKLTSAVYHKKLKLLVAAYSTGVFYLHEFPDVSFIHSLNISEYAVDTVTFNTTGDWIAFRRRTIIAGMGIAKRAVRDETTRSMQCYELNFVLTRRKLHRHRRLRW